jgi:hypothetical protein
LHAAVDRRLEDVHRPIHIEGHDLHAAPFDHRLVGRGRGVGECW